MNSQVANREPEMRTSSESSLRFASFVALMKLLCTASYVRLQEQSLGVTMPGVPALDIEFIGRQAMGFAFTEGNQAGFNVPFGHRFVIEHLNLSCWADCSHLRIQLETKSPHYFRTMTLECSQEGSEPGLSFELSADSPIEVNGSSRSTFLFSNGEVENSVVVPKETYLQVWGYLEPAESPRLF